MKKIRVESSILLIVISGLFIVGCDKKAEVPAPNPDNNVHAAVASGLPELKIELSEQAIAGENPSGIRIYAYAYNISSLDPNSPINKRAMKHDLAYGPPKLLSNELCGYAVARAIKPSAVLSIFEENSWPSGTTSISSEEWLRPESFETARVSPQNFVFCFYSQDPYQDFARKGGGSYAILPGASTLLNIGTSPSAISVGISAHGVFKAESIAKR